MFESVVQFLRSPLWVNPIQSYIDEYCIVFDGAEECPLEFSNLHTGFCDVIDKILEEHLGDLGLTAEQFVEACDANKNKELNSLVSEYILALDDFPTFKAMMEKRNVELELEALKSLSLPVYEPSPGEEDSSGHAERVAQMRRDAEREEEEMEMAIAASMQDIHEDVLQKEREMEDAELKHALAMSIALEKDRARKEEDSAQEEEKAQVVAHSEENIVKIQQSFQEEKEAILEYRNTAVCSSHSTASITAAPTPQSPAPAAPTTAPSPKPVELVVCQPLKPLSSQTPALSTIQLHRGSNFQSKSALPDIKHSDPSPAPVAAAPAPVAPKQEKSKNAPSEEEMAKRQQYLKAQREKIAHAKKESRQKEIEEYESQHTKPAAGTASGSEPSVEVIDEQTKQMRMALGRRFKDDLLHESKMAASRPEK